MWRENVSANQKKKAMCNIVVGALVMLFTVGCSSLQSLNLQRSGLRSVGDVAVTAYLDSVDDDKWEAHQTEIDDIVTRLTEFMTTGEVENLVYPKLVEAIRGLVPNQYRTISNQLLAAVENTSADVKVEKIGQENVDRINAFLAGAATGLRAYKVDHRPPDRDAEAESSPAPSSVPGSDALDAIEDAATGDMPPDEDMDPPTEDDGDLD